MLLDASQAARRSAGSVLVRRTSSISLSETWAAAELAAVQRVQRRQRGLAAQDRLGQVARPLAGGGAVAQHRQPALQGGVVGCRCASRRPAGRGSAPGRRGRCRRPARRRRAPARRRRWPPGRPSTRPGSRPSRAARARGRRRRAGREGRGRIVGSTPPASCFRRRRRQPLPGPRPAPRAARWRRPRRGRGGRARPAPSPSPSTGRSQTRRPAWPHESPQPCRLRRCPAGCRTRARRTVESGTRVLRSACATTSSSGSTVTTIGWPRRAASGQP